MDEMELTLGSVVVLQRGDVLVAIIIIIIIIKEWVKDNVGKNSCLKGQGPPTPPNIHVEEIKIVNKKAVKKRIKIYRGNMQD